MKSKKVFFGLLGTLLILFVGAGYGAYVGYELLNAKSDELVELQLQNYGVQIEQTVATKEKEIAKSYSDIPEIVSNLIPQDKNQSSTILELDQIAREHNIILEGFTFPGSTLGAKATTKNAAATTEVNLSQLEPVKEIAGVYRMVISTKSATPALYEDVVQFLKALENNRRTSQVLNITLDPDEQNASLVEFQIQLSLYIKP